MMSGGENKIPQGCRVGAEYYGGLYRDSAQGKAKAQECADVLIRATGKAHEVRTVVKNASDGLPSFVPEFWYRVVSGTSRQK